MNINALYADGGVIGKNPSPMGGTWCYCRVGKANQMIDHAAGIVTPEDIGLPFVTNNVTELLAAIIALESVPEGWTGTIYSDSKITLNRLMGKGTDKGVPVALWERMQAVRQKLPGLATVLVGGHPNRNALFKREDHRGLPVSIHNVFCDKQCQEQSRRFLASLQPVFGT